MFYFFSHIFIIKLDEPLRNEDIFIISLFTEIQIWVLGLKKFFFCSFWLIFYALDPDPWIRIFLLIRIQEAKILRIQRIQILSTAEKLPNLFKSTLKSNQNVRYVVPTTLQIWDEFTKSRNKRGILVYRTLHFLRPD